MDFELNRTTIGDVCEVFDGPHATPAKTASGPIFLGITSLENGRINLSGVEHLSEEDFVRWTRRVTPRPGDVIFSYETKLGEAALIPIGLRCCLGRRMALLRPDHAKADSRYLLYYYLGPEFQNVIRERTIHGSTVDRLPLIEFPRFPLRLPPLAKQKAIAAVLGALDNRIELNRRMNVTLEAMARALFKSWFVDFDPVRAKIDGYPATGLDAATAALFPSVFTDSPLGPIPKGWSSGTLGDIGVNARRGVQPGEIVPQTPYIALEHMPRRCIALGEWAESADISSGKFAFKRGEILFGKLRPYFHKVGVAPLDGVCSTDILVVTPKSSEWFGFLLAHLSSDSLIQFADLASTGTKMPRTNWTDIGGFKIILPPLSLAAAFTSLVLPMVQRIVSNLHQSRTLAGLRDTLLPKLLSGEVRVSVSDAALGVCHTGLERADDQRDLHQSPQTESSGSNVIPFPVVAVKRTTDEFVEAVLIARLVKVLAKPEYPVGRFRYNKFAYLAHRKVEDDTTKHYLKKAAGPYSPWAKYSGPENIAKRNGYIREANVGGRKGFLPADKIDKIEPYAAKYPVCDAVDWVVSRLRFRKNDDLEVLATVDFAAVELVAQNEAATLENVKRIIATNTEWAPKLNREIFSDEKIASALVELATLYPSLYKS